MRVELPATDTEYVLKDTDSIDSGTDMRGVITYANDDLLRISGFGREELLGASHNMTAHSDMPPEVMKDMWRTLNAGGSWGGIVKCRCKNGGFYWVLANATPYRKKGQMAGITFVHTRPTRTQVEEADALYRGLRESGLHENTACHPATDSGVTVSAGNRMKLFAGSHAVMALLGGMASLLFIFIGSMGLIMSQASVSMGTVHANKVAQLGRIENLLLQNRLEFALVIGHPGVIGNPGAAREKHRMELAEKRIGQINETWKIYTSQPMTPEEKILAGRFAADLNRFIKDGIYSTIALLREGKIKEAALFNEGILDLFEEPLSTGMERLRNQQVGAARVEHVAAESRHNILLNTAVAMIVLGLAMALWSGVALSRRAAMAEISAGLPTRK